MEMKTLQVQTTNSSYPIHIAAGLLGQLGQMLLALPAYQKCQDVLLVSNKTVFPLYGENVESQITNTGKTLHRFLLPDGEQFKSWDMAEQVLSFALSKRLSRRTVLVTLGGGVVGDLSGFVAATYLRGIPFVQIPTTLLAQVDSSVGGKVAVNHRLGKNMIGAFYQPEAVLIDPNTLKTLPKREWLSGLAEVIKYGIIRDQDFYTYLMERREEILSHNTEELIKLIAGCCEIKAEVVSEDEKEQGVRAILNFGHTVGHALELATNYQVYRHGEAVAIGMAAGIHLAHVQGLLTKPIKARLLADLVAWGFSIKLPPISHDEIIAGVGHDKKTIGSNITFILPSKIGQVEIVDQIEPAQIRLALASMDHEHDQER